MIYACECQRRYVAPLPDVRVCLLAGRAFIPMHLSYSLYFPGKALHAVPPGSKSHRPERLVCLLAPGVSPGVIAPVVRRGAAFADQNGDQDIAWSVLGTAW